MANASGGTYKILDEATSKTVLAKHGLHFPKSVTGQTPEEISQTAKKLTIPLALKGLGIAHKSEAGAVILGLNSIEQVKTAAAQMAGVNGYLVEEMVTDAVAELIIGVTRDPTGMFLLTIGAGGILTELLEDTASILLPTTRGEILNAIEPLKIFKILNGYRGKPAADMKAIVDAILAVQTYCLANPHMSELDINPLMALPNSAIAVDALIKLENET